MAKQSGDSSYKLTFEDAVDVWIRVWDGEFQHRIAASYDVNPGRISDVIKERAHKGSKEAARAKYKPKAA